MNQLKSYVAQQMAIAILRLVLPYIKKTIQDIRTKRLHLATGTQAFISQNIQADVETGSEGVLNEVEALLESDLIEPQAKKIEQLRAEIVQLQSPR